MDYGTPGPREIHQQDQWLSALTRSMTKAGITLTDDIRGALAVLCRETALAITDAERDDVDDERIIDGVLAICAMTDHAWSRHRHDRIQ